MPKGSPLDWKPDAEKKLREFMKELSDDDIWKVREAAGEMYATDSPSRSDNAYIFKDYVEGSQEVRDGIDAAFRWWTGYSFDSVVAQALHGANWEEIVARWRPGP
jgi:hypothetical protein